MYKSKFNQGDRVKIKSDDSLKGNIHDFFDIEYAGYYYRVKFDEIESVLVIKEENLEKVTE